MQKLKLLSKAKTLESLAGVLSLASVLPQIRFYVNEYINNKEIFLNRCLKEFSEELIVRSSSSNEDNNITSNAGGFDSVLNVKLQKEDVGEAINRVIKSYGKSVNSEDEIFIQPMLKNVTICGVVFTSDMDTLAPYYVINYDDSGSTSSVTNGDGKDLKTVVVFKDYNSYPSKLIKDIIEASKECEEIFNNKFLDIEFAFSDGKLYILQVRAIVKNNKNDLSSINLDMSLEKLNKKIKKLNTPHPKLLGSRTIFGVMPDWNPAEIIGIKPKRLAMSLYKEIVTDEIWAYQRDNYGYRNLRSFPLLVSFLGIPYIDVRVSFNSFIPKDLHESISLKLVEHYLDELSQNKNHHDKVEFEIVYSCYYFGIDKKLQKLKEKNFSSSEIKRVEFELLELTNKIIDSKNGLYKKDLEKVNLLHKSYSSIVSSQLQVIDKIYWLIEDCKKYGTLPFAGIARAAFVAVQFLNSFVDENILTNEEKNRFLNSIETVSKKLNQDKEKLTKSQFLEKYGHLRPGTYDICSQRYDESYDEYFSDFSCETINEEFTFTKVQVEKIERLIVENGLKSNFEELTSFIKDAIEGREYSKFVFTKHLSKILSLVEEFGAKFGFNKESLAHLDIQKIKNLYSTLDHRDVKEILRFDIDKNIEFYKYTQAIKLPSIIVKDSDIYCYQLEKEEANFITLNSITNKVIDLEFDKNSSLENKIIAIKSADPGYDYLFSKNIGGLITCYGGANSHMAIRCAELGIPAVIGAGEQMFKIYKEADVLMLDAANKQVKVIS